MIDYKLSDREVKDLDPGATWVEVKVPCPACEGKGYHEVEQKEHKGPGMTVQMIKIDTELGEVAIEGCKTCGSFKDALTNTGPGYLVRHVTLLQLKGMLATWA